MEFSYKNGYHESLRMSLFETLYGHIYNNPISSSNPKNMVLIGLDMLVNMEGNIGNQVEFIGSTG